MRDPLTGGRRRVSNSLIRQSRLQLRHDVPGADWVWGGDVEHQIAAKDYRLSEVGRRWERRVYESRRTGPLAFEELRDRRIGPVLGLAVSRSF